MLDMVRQRRCTTDRFVETVGSASLNRMEFVVLENETTKCALRNITNGPNVNIIHNFEITMLRHITKDEACVE
jgi:hypothetical protein